MSKARVGDRVCLLQSRVKECRAWVGTTLDAEKKGLGSSLSFPGCWLKEVFALGDLAHLIECLPSMKEALGWIPSCV